MRSAIGRIGIWAATALLTLNFAACGKKDQTAGAPAASAAETQAAADASNVTSIPGYAPTAGNATSANAAPGNSTY